jgi:hypothetical protein
MAGLAFVVILGVEWENVHGEKERAEKEEEERRQGEGQGTRCLIGVVGCKEPVFALWCLPEMRIVVF